MRAKALVVSICVAGALACGGGESDPSVDRVGELLARLNAETDSIVVDAMRRNGVNGFQAPEPGLTDTYLRSPRRHSQVKRYYDSWQRVDAAVAPTLHQTMNQIANRLAREADLGRQDSMDFDLEAQTAIRNRRREFEVRDMLAGIAIYAYDRGETSSVPAPITTRRSGTTDSVSLQRRQMSAAERETVVRLEEQRQRAAAEGIRRSRDLMAESRAGDLQRHSNEIQRLNDELAALLAQRAAGRMEPR